MRTVTARPRRSPGPAGVRSHRPGGAAAPSRCGAVSYFPGRPGEWSTDERDLKLDRRASGLLASREWRARAQLLREGKGHEMKLLTRVVPSATPYAAATCGWVLHAAHSDGCDTRPVFAAGLPRRCILRADGLARQYRAARARGTRRIRPSAGSPTGGRWPAAWDRPRASRSDVVYLHH